MAKEKTLILAEKICSENNLITIQEYGSIYAYRNGYYQKIKAPKCDSEMHKIIIEDQEGNSFTPSKRDQVIRNVEILSAVPEQSINPEGIFNFKDVLYDIKSDSIANHSPEYKITIQLPYGYRDCIDAPMWKDFLYKVTDGNIEKINILQEFAGYCLMKSCKFERALFLIGRGSNGKSVFAETLSKVFGRQNVSSVSLESLANPVLRSNIINKYVNIDSDLPRDAIKFEEAFRKISSGEPIQFNEKFLPPLTMPTFCKLIYCLNEFPSIDDASNAFYRRMILIPFDVEFSDQNKDVNLKEKLESELAGIFRWCVSGYRRLIKQDGFSKNTYMDKMISEIKADNNPIVAFVEEEIEMDNKMYAIKKRSLYDAFSDWAKRSGHRVLGFKKFNNRFYMEYRKYTKKDYQHGNDRDRCWPNMKFKNNESIVKYGQTNMVFDEENNENGN